MLAHMDAGGGEDEIAPIDDPSPRETWDDDEIAAMRSDWKRSLFEKEFGRVIEQERSSRGWTAEEAARRAAVAYKTWLRVERGDPVRNATMVAVDRLFSLPNGTTLRCWQEGGDIRAEIRKTASGLRGGLAALIPGLGTVKFDRNASARLPVYRRVLSAMAEEGAGTVTSDQLATASGASRDKVHIDMYMLTRLTRSNGPSSDNSEHEIHDLIEQIDLQLERIHEHHDQIIENLRQTLSAMPDDKVELLADLTATEYANRRRPAVQMKLDAAREASDKAGAELREAILSRDPNADLKKLTLADERARAHYNRTVYELGAISEQISRGARHQAGTIDEAPRPRHEKDA